MRKEGAEEKIDITRKNVDERRREGKERAAAAQKEKRGEFIMSVARYYGAAAVVSDVGDT